MNPTMSPEHRREVREFLAEFRPQELELLRKEGLTVSYDKLSPLIGGLYSRDTNCFFPLKKPTVQINTEAQDPKGTGVHEVAHALDRAELKAMVARGARLLGLTASHASEVKPELIALFQDYQARGTAQLAARLVASLDHPEQPSKGYHKTSFRGVHYYYDYQPARDGRPATMDLRLHKSAYDQARELGDAEGGLLVGGAVGIAVGAAVATAVCAPLGIALGLVAALPLGLGLLRHALKKRRVDNWNNFERKLELPDGQAVNVKRQGDTTRVELPGRLQKTPNWTWSEYALDTQQPWEYYAEGIRARQQSPDELREKDPNLLGYLMPKQQG